MTTERSRGHAREERSATKVRVVFACVHNAGRSQMAAAFFNTLVDRTKARAVSAGTSPAPRLHPGVVTAMEEAGIDLHRATPRLLTPEAAAGAHVLITMGCGAACPVLPGVRREDWSLPDPKGQPLARVRQIRDEVRARVAKLVAAEGWGREPRSATRPARDSSAAPAARSRTAPSP